MELWNRKATGILLVALINGLGCGLALYSAIELYKRRGWTLFGTAACLTALILIALMPLNSKVLRIYSDKTPAAPR